MQMTLDLQNVKTACPWCFCVVLCPYWMLDQNLGNAQEILFARTCNRCYNKAYLARLQISLGWINIIQDTHLQLAHLNRDYRIRLIHRHEATLVYQVQQHTKRAQTVIDYLAKVSQ